jgi:PPK2 family polyphosphate:nucleotide phosphotransferase
MNLDRYKIKHLRGVKLSKIETHSGKKQLNRRKLKQKLAACLLEIAKFQNKLFAENRQSLLIILQGMDSAGKDSAIKKIMLGLNPQGAVVHSFKHPSDLELDHDYLWRHANKLPEHGQVTIFNRSHYENVLISKVHPELILSERLPGIMRTDQVTEEFWTKRYEQINSFEKSTIYSGTHILKFFLHLSKKEQRNRFLERIENKEKHWKFSSGDITERNYWSDYQKAYEQTFKKTSTKIAPWHIVPADDKQFAHVIIGELILEKFKSMNPCFPPISKKERALLNEAREKLKKEGD